MAGDLAPSLRKFCMSPTSQVISSKSFFLPRGIVSVFRCFPERAFFFCCLLAYPVGISEKARPQVQVCPGTI